MRGFDAKAAKATFTAAAVLLAIALVYAIRETLVVFILALLLAYLVYPLVGLIERRMPEKARPAALAIAYLLVIALATGFILYIGSAVADEAGNLARQAPALVAQLKSAPEAGAPAGGLRDQAAAFLEGQVREHYDEIVAKVPQITLRVVSASKNLLYIVIIPILSFFMLRDGRRILDGLLEQAGLAGETATGFLQDAHTLLLQYMRALLTLCLATLVAFAIVLSLMGVPYALLLASVAFPLEFIPLVGPLIAAAIILSVCVVSGFAHLWWVAVFLALYRLFQDYVLNPHLMSRGVELHPLLVIFGVFAGEQLGGTAGVFLSVPVLALIRLFYHWMSRPEPASPHQ